MWVGWACGWGGPVGGGGRLWGRWTCGCGVVWAWLRLSRATHDTFCVDTLLADVREGLGLAVFLHDRWEGLGDLGLAVFLMT